MEVFEQLQKECEGDAVMVMQRALQNAEGPLPGLACALLGMVSLELREQAVSLHALRALGQTPKLASLLLVSCQVCNLGARALAASLSLRTLALPRNEVGDAGAQALALLPSLGQLDLAHNEVGDAGAVKLAGAASLWSLRLDGNLLGDVGASALAAAPNLRALQLRNCENLCDSGVAALASAPHLRKIALDDNLLGDDAADWFARWSQATDLRLRANSIGPSGAAALARGRFRSLDLGQNPLIGDEGASALVGAQGLEELRLDGCGVSAGFARSLQGRPSVPGVMVL